MNRALRTGAKIGLGLWAVAAIVVGGTLEARHLLALPTPPLVSAGRDASMAALQGASEHFVAWHILLGSCPCSRRVARHLAERAAVADVREVIVWVDTDGKWPAPTSGLPVQTMTPTQLQERFGAVAAPMLLVVDAEGVVRYSGGYSRHKQGVLEDAEILESVRHGGGTVALPVFGCAVAAELARLMDPLGIASLGKKD